MPPQATREELVAALKHARDRYDSLSGRHARILRENAELRRRLGLSPDTEIITNPNMNTDHA
jgi:hypothetical protein